jgi:hypothetical protein
MDTLQQLAVALGLAGLSGLNLYLTVFVTGLAIQQPWIALADRYHDLAVLGHPTIIFIAGVLYALEFFADKVPWVDSLWDSVHTIIRPIGGAMLAIKVLGQPDPTFDVIIGLMFGSVTLLTHTAKAGTRLLANGSPEPFSNIALSLGEDATVVGGLALLNKHPILFMLLMLSALAAIIYLAPKIFRSVRTKAWLAWRKLNAPALSGEVVLPTHLTPDNDALFHKLNLLNEHLAWAVPCLSAGKKLPAHADGHLVATAEDARQVYFVGKIGFTKIATPLDLSGYKVAHETRFLCEKIILYPLDKRPKHIFLLDRSRSAIARKLAEDLAARLAKPAAEVPALAELQPA